MERRTFASRAASLRALKSRRAFARTGMFAFIASVLMVGGPASALALENGEYIMQCSCPVWWEGDWDGNGVFNEDDSLDTIALANGTAVLLIHELPIDAMSFKKFSNARTGALEDNRNLSDVEVLFQNGSNRNGVVTGRSWVNADGDTMLSWQSVMVWETNYLLSMEFIAPEDDFEDAWFDTMGDVALIGIPIADMMNGEAIMDLFEL